MPISNPALNASPVSLTEKTLSVLSSGALLTLENLPLKVANFQPSRRGLTIYNDSDEMIYFDVSGDVSSNQFMFCLSPGAFYEMPYPCHHDALYCRSLNSTADKSLHVREIYSPN